MKHLFIIASLFICSLASAQNFELKNKKQDSKFTLTVENKDFEISITADSLCYVPRVSQKTGNTYRYYIGYLSKHSFNDLPVFFDNKGYYTLIVNKNGFLSKKELISK